MTKVFLPLGQDTAIEKAQWLFIAVRLLQRVRHIDLYIAYVDCS